MTAILGILAFFVILAVLILVHEIGHFTFAKLFGVRVDEFAMGFPPRIKVWRRGDTLYTLNALPLGGFVRMAGENGQDADPDSLGAKPPWQRLIILLAGPAMNILLAIAIFFFAFMGGSPRGTTTVTAIAPHSPAAQAGLKKGDRILAEAGVRVKYLDDLQSVTRAHLGGPVSLLVQRGSRTFKVSLTPRTSPPADQGPIGIELAETTSVRYSPLQALRTSVDQLTGMVSALPQVLQSATQHGGQGVSGPIGIAHITTKVVQSEPQEGPGSLLALMALLSANLGVLNLLPLPALDGGRIVFVLISWIRRRNLDPEVEGLIHLVGMAVLLFLIALVSYHDIVRWVTGGAF